MKLQGEYFIQIAFEQAKRRNDAAQELIKTMAEAHGLHDNQWPFDEAVWENWDWARLKSELEAFDA